MPTSWSIAARPSFPSSSLFEAETLAQGDRQHADVGRMREEEVVEVLDLGEGEERRVVLRHQVHDGVDEPLHPLEAGAPPPRTFCMNWRAT